MREAAEREPGGGAMPAIVDPVTGLEFYDMSHPWGYYTPIWPGYEDLKVERGSYHAKYGAMAQRITAVMHTSTHANAPIHLVPGGAGIGELPLDRFFGNGVVLSVPKRKWELIAAEELAATRPAIQPGDIVIVATGWHKRYSDSKDYFGYAPGLSREAAEWLAAKRVKLFGIDTGAIDHPLATSLGPHRNGPQIKDLASEYKKATGRNAAQDFPDWNPAHKALLRAGIPTVENVGGDVAEIAGSRCTIHACPWRWTEGDACVIRLVAIRDPRGTYRLAQDTNTTGADGLRFFDLSHRWGASMPRWPGGGATAGLPRVELIEFHAKHGVLTHRLEFHMHRGTHMDAPIHVLENTPTIIGYDMWRFFGTGVAVSIPKGKWQVITPDDLEKATPKIQPNDVVMINTGSHRQWGDNDDYFAYSPGLYKEAAEWLVEKKVKMVGVDVQALDHPMGTYMIAHGSGPTVPHLSEEYKAATGRDPLEDFPLWEPAHKILMSNGIPGIENVGGDLDQVTGNRCTFMAFTWRWPQGDGCSLRVVAVVDPAQRFRIGG